jgi:antitoxin (DNA-binding transcriptional repressor) of toxin-antitoxin stability system
LGRASPRGVDGLLGELYVVVAVSALDVLVLEEGGCGEDDVGVVGGVSEELLVDDGEEIGAREAAQYGRLVGSDGRGVGVVDKKRVDRGAVVSFAAEFGECLAEDGHVDDAGFAAEGAGLHEVGALEGCFIPAEGAAGGELESAAVVFPRAGERGQHGDGTGGGAAVVAALHAVVEADDGGGGGGVVAGEALDIGDGDAGERGDVIGWVFGDALAELIEAAGPAGNVVLIEEAIAHDDVHEAEGKRGVSAGIDRNVPIRGAGGARGVGIEDHELGAVAAGFFDERPEVDVVAVDVGGPGDDELRVREGFRVGAEFAAVDGDKSLATGFRTDGAVELRRAETVEEAAIHGAVVEDADGAGVGVGQDGFGAVVAGDGRKAGGDGVEGFIPGDALEGFGFAAVGQRGLGNTGAAAHRIEEPVGRVDAVEVLRYFAAEKASGDGMRGVAAETGGAAGFVDGDEDPAGVGAVMRADSMDGPGHRNRVQRVGCRAEGKATSRCQLVASGLWRPAAGVQGFGKKHAKLSYMTKSYETVNIHEAKTHFSRIVEQILASGEPVTIARAGKPVVIVSAHPGARPARRTLGLLRGKVQLPRDLGIFDAEIQKMFEGRR